MKSNKPVEENAPAKPRLSPTTGQSGKQEKWNGPGGENGRLSLEVEENSCRGFCRCLRTFNGVWAPQAPGALEQSGWDGSPNPKHDLEFMSIGGREENRPTRKQSLHSQNIDVFPLGVSFQGRVVS